MIPVVMLVINIGALSCLIMTYPSFEHFLVIYLMMVALIIIKAILLGELRINNLLNGMFNGTQVAHLSFSVLINISATSIIALKAWCVRVHGVFGDLFAN
jgi:hypothetical protein